MSETEISLSPSEDAPPPESTVPTKKAFVEPKLTFIEPKVSTAGSVKDLTLQGSTLFAPFSPS